MDSKSKIELSKKIRRIISRGALENKKIVLFGASVFSKEVRNCLENNGYSINAVVDNDTRKIGKRFLDLVVSRPEEVLLPYDTNVYVFIFSPSFFREITFQLGNMGYRGTKQVCTLNFKTSDSMYMFARTGVYHFVGRYWYQRLVKGHSSDCTVFIAPYTGTGDIYLIGLFFYAYVKKHGIEDYVFAVVSNACKKVAEMFEIQNIYVLPHQAGGDMISLARATGHYQNLTVLNDGWMGDPLQWFRGYKGLNFEKMFRYFVFGFDDSVPHQLPPRKAYSHEIDALFKKHGLAKGKTVVLSPYSNTLFDLPDDVLEKIVGHCKAQGLIPVTNCAGDEKPIHGTEAVFFPLSQAIDFMDAAGCFVGVRSGLCDIISSSTCKKIIIYEKDGLFYKTSHFDYFSLNAMGLCDDAIEIEYRDDLKDEILTKIFSTLA